MGEFKVGEWIQITKSDKCWNDYMNQWDGKIVQITHIGKPKSGESIKFKNIFGSEFDADWNWCYSWGHFKKIKQPVVESNYEIY